MLNEIANIFNYENFCSTTKYINFISSVNLTSVIQNGDCNTLNNAIMNLNKKVSCIKSYF